MTTYAVPTTVRPSTMQLGLLSNTWRFTSVYTGASQTVEMPGARWTVTLQWPAFKPAEAGEYEAFLAKLRGGANSFTTYNFSREAPLGTMRGTLTVNGAHSAGVSTVSITGGAGQAAKTLLMGDYLSINGEYNMIASNATANGSGVISAVLVRPIRTALTGGEAVTWDKPTATFMLSDPAVAWQYDKALARNFVLAGEEVY